MTQNDNRVRDARNRARDGRGKIKRWTIAIAARGQASESVTWVHRRPRLPRVGDSHPRSREFANVRGNFPGIAKKRLRWRQKIAKNSLNREINANENSRSLISGYNRSRRALDRDKVKRGGSGRECDPAVGVAG